MNSLLNTIRALPPGWAPPEIPDPCGPADLAAILASARRRRSAGSRLPARLSPISEDGLRSMVEAAFYASLLPDEGRLPRCRLRNAEPHARSRVITFERTPATASTLTRLATLCHGAEHALSIVEDLGALLCDGLVDTGPMGLDGLPGRPEIVSGAGHVALDLQILGPGHLIVRDRASLLNCELTGGRLRFLSSIWAAPAVRALFDRFGAICLDAAAPDPDDPARDLFGGAYGLTWLGCALFGPTLGDVVHARHGGAIVVLPGAAAEDGPIAFGTEVSDLDLKAETVEYWSACLAYSPDDMGAVSRWQRARARLRSKFGALAGLTSVDGCVVLDDTLRLRRFGAQLTVEDAQAEAARPFRRAATGEDLGYREFMTQFAGTRHRSAARLCAVVPGAIAFVISQDGGLTLFCSDADAAYGYGPMDSDWWG